MSTSDVNFYSNFGANLTKCQLLNISIHIGQYQYWGLLRVGRTGESRFGQRVIGSKAEVTWYYETVANHSLATPSASDSHRYAFWHRYYSFLFTISVQNLIFTNPVGNANPTKQCESLAEGVASE